jgi:hypothetical protein
MRRRHTSLLKDKRAVSPAISSVILTAAGIVMILVAMSYANNILSLKMAQNEYNTNKQFMLTTGQQIDDVAWTVGRTQTISYSNKYGNVGFLAVALNYTFRIHYAFQYLGKPYLIWKNRNNPLQYARKFLLFG